MEHDRGGLEKYRLKHNGADVTISGRYWKTSGIYLSDVCIVAEVEPVVGSDFHGAGAKEELYKMLRGISSRAMDYDLVRPLAAFVKIEEGAYRIRSWGAEQEWHRGAFVLYVMDNEDLAPTSEELLDHRSKLASDVYYKPQRDVDVLNGVYERIDPVSAETRALFGTIMDAVSSTGAAREERVRLVRKSLRRWREEVDMTVSERAQSE